MIRRVAFFAVVFGLFAVFCAAAVGDRTHDAAPDRSLLRSNAVAPERTWPERNPALVGVAVGGMVFVVGTIVVVAMNTSRANDQRT